MYCALQKLTFDRKWLIRGQPEKLPTEAASDLSLRYNPSNDSGVKKVDSSNVLKLVSRRECPPATIESCEWNPSSVCEVTSSVEHLPHSNCGPNESKVAHVLQSYSEPFAIRSHTMRSYCSSIGSMCCSSGPMMFKRWTEGGDASFSSLSDWSAFGLKFVVRSPFLCERTISVEVFIERKTYVIQKFSIRCLLSSTMIISSNSPAVRLAKLGDVKGMRELCEAGRARCMDTIPNGTSLLHVCSSKTGLCRGMY